MSDLTQLVQLQYRVAAFLAEQTSDQLLALLDGRVTLALVEVGNPKPAETPSAPVVTVAAPTRSRRRATESTVEADEIAARLRSCESVDEAAVLLRELKLTVPALKAVAKALGTTTVGNKPDLERKILTQAVGARNKYAVLRQG